MQGYHEGNPLIGFAYHEPVLLREIIEALEVKKGKWYLDLTLGDGGHSLEILRLGGNVLGLDVDPEALERVRGRLGELERLGGLGEYRLIQGNFRDIKNLLPASLGEQTETKFAGVLFDLGVSSLQLENPERGFSFLKEGPLDMRMDPNLQIRALDLIHAGGRKELYELFNRLGEEKLARALGNALVRARALKPIKTTKELAELVENVVGRSKGGIHPATRAFQALRIAVNDELNALEEGLVLVKDLIQNHGRILVISFHSLEDRIVKFTFRKWEEEGMGKVITKKPILPNNDEVRENPRSRSGKLRVFEIQR